MKMPYFDKFYPISLKNESLSILYSYFQLAKVSKNSLQINIYTDDTKTKTTELTVTEFRNCGTDNSGTANQMSDEIGIKEKADDGDKVAKDEKHDTDIDKHGDEKPSTEITGTENTSTEVPKEIKPRSVSFNRDVHVKRFGESNSYLILIPLLV